MNLQIQDGTYANTRFITHYFIDNNEIDILTVNGEYDVLITPEHDEVNQRFLDVVVRIISTKKLTQPILTQHELWQEIHRCL